MKVFVSEKCIACHRCYLYYPEVFEKDDGGYAKPRITDDIDRTYEDMAVDAIETCPVGAISCNCE
ncbi:ferredoxin [Bacillus sp. BRMEA1]|uniref:ferredoxin n=1 Tax=Neobacillus endophyticus TaxID=2738405 RepID=UPI0015631400|nr:ferredoxin [Neobacillus endophyticus]NRD79177.1 ferredoxin [Neobacillus endophyticus]